MIRVSLALGLLLLPAAQEEPKPPTKTELKKLVSKYVAATPEERGPILARIRLADTLRTSELKSYARRIYKAFRRLPRATKDDPQTLRLKDFPLKYSILGNPKPGAPVVIYMHGGGASTTTNDDQWGKAKSSSGRLGLPLRLVPRVFEDTIVGWREKSAWITIAGLIDEVKRTFRTDSNRVYLGGYSMGSWGVATTGPVLADRLAACFAMAGGGSPRAAVENMRNCPYIIHVGDQDHTAGRLKMAQWQRDRWAKLQADDPEGYALVYKEYPGVGHQLPGVAHSEIGAWLKEQERDPYPRKIAWRPVHERFLYFYWLKCDRPRVGLITAEITDGQRIEVTAPKRAKVTVFLNDKMVSFKKEVTVILNGEEKFKGKLTYSLSALLETLVAKEDLQQYFTARIDLFD